MKIYLSIIAALASGLGLQAQVCLSHSGGSPFASGAHPASCITADFNADGKADLAVVNLNNNKVSVLRGNGSGGFSPAVSFTVGNSPNSIISADFNADGKADLATANYSTSDVSVLLGDGLGNFSPAVSFTAGQFPFSVTSADFDNDGKADLATANSTTSDVSVLLGNGAGSFSPPVNFAVGGFPASVMSADVNGDGNADLATANYYGNTVSVLLGTGAGSFAAAVNVAVGFGPFCVTGGDFNGDGKTDLATADRDNNTISVLLGNGAGNFAPAVSYAVASAPCSLTSADLNADGKVDLAVANAGIGSDTLSVLTGDGAGNFDAAQSFSVGSQPLFVVSDDFDEDGEADLAVTTYMSGQVAILLSCAVTGFADLAGEQQLTVYPNPAGETIHVSLTGSGASSLPGKSLVVQITDVLGSTVMQVETPDLEHSSPIDISPLSNGVYVVNVKTTTFTLTKKVVVNR